MATLEAGHSNQTWFTRYGVRLREPYRLRAAGWRMGAPRTVVTNHFRRLISAKLSGDGNPCQRTCFTLSWSAHRFLLVPVARPGRKTG